MPELPDLEYVRDHLASWLPGHRIVSARLHQPLVIRLPAGGVFGEWLRGRRIQAVRRHGPFLVVSMEDTVMVVHFMLTGRFSQTEATARRPGFCCFSVVLDDGRALHYLDRKKMGKVYVDQALPTGEPLHVEAIPLYTRQGVDVLSPEFTLERFRELVSVRRQQVRVFLMDQTNISAIGNAYADEILFEAALHPKVPCNRLTPDQVQRLWRSVVGVIRWAVDEVNRAAPPLEREVRDHLRVRNRKGQPCPKCGTTIRRVSVLGWDAFYCPSCQKAAGRQFIPWE